jgi:hypothetical protein
MAALKIGHCSESGKKDWEKEVFRLKRDLKDLYDKIDDNYSSFL